MQILSLDYLVFSETKIDESFSTSLFNVEGNKVKVRCDRNKYDRGLIEFVRRGLT